MSFALNSIAWWLTSVALLQAPVAPSDALPKTQPSPVDAQSDAPLTEAPAPQPPVQSAPSVVPPRRLSALTPTWPSTVAGDEPVAVVLAVTLDADAHVVLLEIVVSAGQEFDEEAQRVVQAASFEPGRRDGVAVSTRFIEVVVFVNAALSQTAPALPAPRAPAVVKATPSAHRPSGAARAASASVTSPKSERSAPQEVLVKGRTRSDTIRQSAAAVDVVDLDRERNRSSDLGEILARKTSTVTRREAGLGSAGQYAIGGLGGDRVRFFIDGVPLQFSPYTQGISNIPLNFLDRVEVYSGVVPVRFGSDAVGGAIHVVTQRDVRRTRASASYELGSFNTHRVQAGAQYFHPGSGGFARVGAFFDHSDNSYEVDVEVASDEGRPEPKRLPRFHDAYQGRGAVLELGAVDKAWADRITLQGYLSAYDKEVQSNPWMTSPYGEVDYGRKGHGVNLRHVKALTRAIGIESAFGYSRRTTHFRDLANCRYDWYGRCRIELPLAGEVASVATDRRFDEDALFARSVLEVAAASDHTLRLAVAPTLTARKGQDARISAVLFDELGELRRLTSGVVGLEYESNWFAGRLSNIAFVKAYGQWIRARKQLGADEIEDIDNDSTLFGLGDSARFFLTDELYLKAAYERAARLPNADEVFGDGGQLTSNPDLLPERSHNFNFGVHVDDWPTALGSVRAGATGIARFVDDYFGRFSDGFTYATSNVARVRVLGAEANAGFSAPQEYVGFDARASYLDIRNFEGVGSNALFEGDRLPNLPYMQGSGSVFVRYPGLVHADDQVELFWNVRYVHPFLLGWESAAVDAEREKVSKQVVQGAGVTYGTRGPGGHVSSSLEVNNLTNEKVYDFYGSQRPGRAFYLKLTFDTH